MNRLDQDLVGVDALCDAIVDRYHATLHERLPRIQDRLTAIGATASSPAFEMVRSAFREVAGLIELHMAKEEQLLFPAIAALSMAERRGERAATAFATVLHPIRAMEAEHARIELAIDRLRELARAVVKPDSLHAQWHHCMTELAKLDAELREHHRTENELLFPRALELERRLL